MLLHKLNESIQKNPRAPTTSLCHIPSLQVSLGLAQILNLSLHKSFRAPTKFLCDFRPVQVFLRLPRNGLGCLKDSFPVHSLHLPTIELQTFEAGVHVETEKVDINLRAVSCEEYLPVKVGVENPLWLLASYDKSSSSAEAKKMLKKCCNGSTMLYICFEEKEEKEGGEGEWLCKVGRSGEHETGRI